MKKLYVKPEMDVQEFAAEDTIMNSSAPSCIIHETTGTEGCPITLWTLENPGCLTVSDDGVCSFVVE